MRKILFAAVLLILVGMTAKAQETNYSKSDFVPGDEIIFDDPVEKEKLGEFPSHWDFLAGEECEIVNHNGAQAIKLSGWYSEIGPLMKKADYLPEEFTVEFDVWSNATMGYSDNDWIRLELYSEEYPDGIVRMDLNPAVNNTPDEAEHANLVYTFQPPTGDSREGSAKGELLDPLIKANTWLHVAASFNKRAFKYYVNGTRMANLPNVARPTRLKLVSISSSEDKDRFFIKNVRIAKGAVPLYDRLASEGKIVTYAITFETGKADLKPESVIEINRVAKLMQEHTDLRFEVQGHCDNTGSDAINVPLSQQRAEAIVAALVKQGIDKSRLTAVGKGSQNPIAPNTDAEGRAKNRRVEFVKK
ncbi:MAG: OmpA family protein [Bacteroidales bacterium]|nr:OmpA family protein [Bacteroidales bacterium]